MPARTRTWLAVIVCCHTASDGGGHETTADEDEECCADSGATDVMLPDFLAFVSYHKCYNHFALLGADTKLPILGEGTTKFSLNSKIVLI